MISIISITLYTGIYIYITSYIPKDPITETEDSHTPMMRV